MTEAVPWVAISVFFAVVTSLGAIATVIAFWMRLGAKLQKADSASAMATAALGKADVVSAQLAEYKVQAAQQFASNQTISTVVQSFDERIKSLTQRIDTLIGVLLERRRDDK